MYTHSQCCGVHLIPHVCWTITLAYMINQFSFHIYTFFDVIHEEKKLEGGRVKHATRLEMFRAYR